MNGIVDSTKVVSIANRLRAAPKSMRESVTAELLNAVFEENKPENRADLDAIRMDLADMMKGEKDHEVLRGLMTAYNKLRRI